MPDLSDVLVFLATLGTAGACLYVAILTKRATRSMERIEELATCMTALAVLADVLQAQSAGSVEADLSDDFAVANNEGGDNLAEEFGSDPGEQEPVADFAIEPADVGPQPEQWEGNFLGDEVGDATSEPGQSYLDPVEEPPVSVEETEFEIEEDLNTAIVEPATGNEPAALPETDMTVTEEASELDVEAAFEVEAAADVEAPFDVEPELVNEEKSLEIVEQTVVNPPLNGAAGVDEVLVSTVAEDAEPAIESALVEPTEAADPGFGQQEDQVSTLMARIQMLEQKLDTGHDGSSDEALSVSDAKPEPAIDIGSVPGLVDLSAEGQQTSP